MQIEQIIHGFMAKGIETDALWVNLKSVYDHRSNPYALRPEYWVQRPACVDAVMAICSEVDCTPDAVLTESVEGRKGLWLYAPIAYFYYTLTQTDPPTGIPYADVDLALSPVRRYCAYGVSTEGDSVNLNSLFHAYGCPAGRQPGHFLRKRDVKDLIGYVAETEGIEEQSVCSRVGKHYFANVQIAQRYEESLNPMLAITKQNRFMERLKAKNPLLSEAELVAKFLGTWFGQQAD